MLGLSREETVLYIVLASHKECVDNVKIRELFGVISQPDTFYHQNKIRTESKNTIQNEISQRKI